MSASRIARSLSGVHPVLVARALPGWALAALLMNHAVQAQAPEEVARWYASLDAPATVRAGAGAGIDLKAEILDGWHVYALTQPPGGPIPLKVTLTDESVARTAGALSGTTPEKRHDPSFDLDTQFFRHTLALRIPITVQPNAPPGPGAIPVEVRFQSCNDRICLPPKTVRLTVAVTVIPAI